MCPAQREFFTAWGEFSDGWCPLGRNGTYAEAVADAEDAVFRGVRNTRSARRYGELLRAVVYRHTVWMTLGEDRLGTSTRVLVVEK